MARPVALCYINVIVVLTLCAVVRGTGLSDTETEPTSCIQLQARPHLEKPCSPLGGDADDWRMPTEEESVKDTCSKLSQLLANHTLQDLAQSYVDGLPSDYISTAHDNFEKMCSFSSKEADTLVSIMFGDNSSKRLQLGGANECCREQNGMSDLRKAELGALGCTLAVAVTISGGCCAVTAGAGCAACIAGLPVEVWPAWVGCSLFVFTSIKFHDVMNYIDCVLKDKFRIRRCRPIPPPLPPAPPPPKPTTTTTTCPPYPKPITASEAETASIRDDCPCYCHAEGYAEGWSCRSPYTSDILPCCDKTGYCALRTPEGGGDCLADGPFVTVADGECNTEKYCGQSAQCQGSWCVSPPYKPKVLSVPTLKPYCAHRTDCGPGANVLADECSENKTLCESSGFCDGKWCEAEITKEQIEEDPGWITSEGYCAARPAQKCDDPNNEVYFDKCSKIKDYCGGTHEGGSCEGIWCDGPAPTTDFRLQNALQFMLPREEDSTKLKQRIACNAWAKCQPLFCPGRNIIPVKGRFPTPAATRIALSRAPVQMTTTTRNLMSRDGMSIIQVMFCEETFQANGMLIACSRDSALQPPPWKKLAEGYKEHWKNRCLCNVINPDRSTVEFYRPKIR